MLPWTAWVQSRQHRPKNLDQSRSLFCAQWPKTVNTFSANRNGFPEIVLCIRVMHFWHPHWNFLNKRPENSCSIHGLDIFFSKKCVFFDELFLRTHKMQFWQPRRKKPGKNRNFFISFQKIMKFFPFKQNCLSSKPTSGQVYCIFGKAGEKIPPQVPKLFVRSRRISLLNFFWKIFSQISASWHLKRIFEKPVEQILTWMQSFFTLIPKIIRRKTSSSKWSSGHIEGSSHEIAEKVEKKAETFRLNVHHWWKFSLEQKNCFPQNNLVAI